MKIGIDISPIFYQRGGVGNYALHLVENLIKLKSGHRFFLYSDHSSNEDIPFLNDPAVTFIQGARPYLKYKIWRERIDVLHGPNFRLPGSGVKGNVITIHDLALEKFPSFGRKTFGSGFSSWKTRRRAISADHIIAVSQSAMEDIVNIFQVPRDKVSAIYNGVDNFFFADRNHELFFKIKEKIGIKKDRFILFTGTVEPRKNVATLLKAYSKNRDLRNGYSLVLTGGRGWKNENIKRLMRDQGIDNEVTIAGYVSKEELRVLYSFASCFVFPSIYEGFGIPLLEAMACGAPVVCSNSSSIPEVVGNAAILVDPYDVKGFSVSIKDVVENNDLRKMMIQKGLERVKHFSWERASKETLQIYEKIYLG